jgi:hypothetical protein
LRLAGRKRAGGSTISGKRRAWAPIFRRYSAVLNRLFSLWPLDDGPTLDWLTAWSRYLSPYDVNA